MARWSTLIPAKVRAAQVMKASQTYATRMSETIKASRMDNSEHGEKGEFHLYFDPAKAAQRSRMPTSS